MIDGTDGSGKATQTALLVKNLRRQGYKVKVEDFPQYGKRSASMVEDYLNGFFGSAKELGPYIPSIFYAVDRFAASKRIKKNLKNGHVVISNRYVTASMAHQGGKIGAPNRRKKFFKWLFELEFGLLGLPRPNLNIILHMPARVAQQLVDQKKQRVYTKKKRDIHEADIKHLQAAEKIYLALSREFKYPIVECFNKGRILTREAVSKLVLEKVKRVL